MAIKKEGERWRVDIQPGGRGEKRIRKTFDTKAEALRFERFAQAEAQNGKPWDASEERDKRRLSDLVAIWYERHGVTLKDGENRRIKLLAICERMDDPKARAWNAGNFTRYRAERMQEASDNTVNNELAYMKAMFSELKRCEEWKGSNPLENVRKIKVDEKELSFLSTQEIERILKVLGDSDAGKVTRVCLATGARWSEAEGLRAEQVRRFQIDFTGTKSGKNRSIPIAESLWEMIARDKGRLFAGCYSQFRAGIEQAEIELPSGQLTHVLRHTFASHFMQNGGNILTLQRALGHQSLAMTMRYAHLAPDHLQEVLKLNPLA